MLTHFIKSTYRQFLKNKLFTFINLSGLSISMAVCFVIVLFTYYEYSFDSFHEKSQSIYRLSTQTDYQGRIMAVPFSSAPMGEELYHQAPEVLSFTRMGQPYAGVLGVNNEFFELNRTMYADSNFFQFFSFNLIEGDINTVLSRPKSVVLSSSAAERLFPYGENPIGKVVSINDLDGWEITGIAADCPPNSHINFDALQSFASMEEFSPERMGWRFNNYFTFLELANGFDTESLLSKADEIIYEPLNSWLNEHGVNVNLTLMPITDIRLHSNLNYEMLETGTQSKIYWFTLIALFE